MEGAPKQIDIFPIRDKIRKQFENGEHPEVLSLGEFDSPLSLKLLISMINGSVKMGNESKYKYRLPTRDELLDSSKSHDGRFGTSFVWSGDNASSDEDLGNGTFLPAGYEPWIVNLADRTYSNRDGGWKKAEAYLVRE